MSAWRRKSRRRSLRQQSYGDTCLLLKGTSSSSKRSARVSPSMCRDLVLLRRRWMICLSPPSTLLSGS
ncbi:hypothetical protein AB1N83_008447 [Pleurotus pulmonarius]